MPVRLIAYPPDGAATTCLWRMPQRLRIGRAPECECRLDHPSISRLHAELVHTDGHWQLHDAASKNGSFVNGARLTGPVTLTEATWLRFGDVHCEFTALDEKSAERAEQRLIQRRESMLAFSQRVQQLTALPDLLDETLRAVVELTDCERGFLLLTSEHGLRVRASHGLTPRDLRGNEFLGSAGAAQRALRERVAVVVNDIGADAELRARASVLTGGLRTLLCLPLLVDDQAIGLVYVDSRRPHAAIGTLDLELLRAFTERAAVWIAARRIDESLLALAAQPPAAWVAAFAIPASGSIA
jgi:hypothetical protein